MLARGQKSVKNEEVVFWPVLLAGATIAAGVEEVFKSRPVKYPQARVLQVETESMRSIDTALFSVVNSAKCYLNNTYRLSTIQWRSDNIQRTTPRVEDLRHEAITAPPDRLRGSDTIAQCRCESGPAIGAISLRQSVWRQWRPVNLCSPKSLVRPIQTHCL